MASTSSSKPFNKDGWLLPAVFLMIAFCFLPAGGTVSDQLQTTAVVFVSILFEAVPFMLAGALAGGLIEAFVSRERMTALLPRNKVLTVFIAAGAGIFFPVCECAVVPVVRRLMGKGLPVSAAVGYLLGGPIVNPIVAASTALAYGFSERVVLLRLLMGYGIAVAVGLMMDRLFPENQAVLETIQPQESLPRPQGTGLRILSAPPAPVSQEASCPCCQAHTGGLRQKLAAAFRHGADDFMAAGHYLVIGAFIAALAQTYLNRAEFLHFAAVPAVATGLMIVLAILLNLCSEADAFIAASFRGIIPFPAQLAFMLTGPMLDLKLLLMYRTVFRKRAILVLALLILTAIIAATTGLVLSGGWEVAP